MKDIGGFQGSCPFRKSCDENGVPPENCRLAQACDEAVRSSEKEDWKASDDPIAY